MEMKKNEHLSAVFDDEATDFESRRMLDELSKDEAIQSTWARYDLIGECLRQPEASSASLSSGSDFLASLHKRLEEEALAIPAANDKDVAPNVHAISGNHAIDLTNVNQSNQAVSLQNRTWFKPAIGLAATATFAAVVLVSAPDLTGERQTTTVTQSIAANDHKTIKAQELAALEQAEAEALAEAEREKRLQLAAEQRQRRLQYFLESHVEHASRTTIAPTIRTVALGY